MKVGAILDNVQTALGETVPQSSIDKLAAMQAQAVGTLWTGGTRHGRDVYERCEAALDRPLYILRVGGHRQTVEEWMDDARDALAEVPGNIVLESRVVLACGNEPNLEGYASDPAGYGALFQAIFQRQLSIPVLFACPSMGVDGWRAYLGTALHRLSAPPENIIINAYEHLIWEVAWIKDFCEARRAYIGEVNSLQPNRAEWFQQMAWPYLDGQGIKAALIFIAGGEAGGAWDERYIISGDEAAGLAWDVEWLPPTEVSTMPTDERIDQLLAQNALITEALIDFRHGRFEGAEGMDGKIVALNGGVLPEGWSPSYPPLV